ncbi:methyltransferase domain-containing protein [Mycobacterium sp.]|jgi:ubiquinone/menaquinone biosynthesis C-methylase UbiE|uniref:class I SAM-dependent methyltransferase n=1 Tax=Mycobacterium sp. TaxID=1785 RepID=UPI003F97301B
MKISTKIAGVAALGIAGATAMSTITDEAPYPYSGWRSWVLDLQLPFLTNKRLDALLALQPGHRVLEIGPGTGCQSLHVARQVAPTGQLDIVDIQQEFLDAVMRRAKAKHVPGIVATLADARDLPFMNDQFDAAYVVTALGEIPEPLSMLREFHRVLKPTGRLVVGEFFDRHYIPAITLMNRANATGFEVVDRIGVPFAYYAQLRPIAAV